MPLKMDPNHVTVPTRKFENSVISEGPPTDHSAVVRTSCCLFCKLLPEICFLQAGTRPVIAALVLDLRRDRMELHIDHSAPLEQNMLHSVHQKDTSTSC